MKKKTNFPLTLIMIAIVLMVIWSIFDRSDPLPTFAQQPNIDSIKREFNDMIRLKDSILMIRSQEVIDLKIEKDYLTDESNRHKQAANMWMNRFYGAKSSGDTGKAIDACDSLAYEYKAFVETTTNQINKADSIIVKQTEQIAVQSEAIVGIVKQLGKFDTAVHKMAVININLDRQLANERARNNRIRNNTVMIAAATLLAGVFIAK